MSQEKVDKYKQEKANRQQIMRREKLVRRLEYGGITVVLAAAVVWFSVAVYKNVEAGKPVEKTTTEMDVTALQNYLSGLSAGDTEE